MTLCQVDGGGVTTSDLSLVFPPLKYATVKLVVRPLEKPCHEEVAAR